MRGLLELERDSGIHGRGGLLADPSAAMAILWLRRSMDFMVGVQEGPPCANSMLANSTRVGRAREGVCRPRDAMHAWCDARACCVCRPT